MKHKKFVKQLMAMGYDRNTAKDLASAYAYMGKSYEDALACEKEAAYGSSEIGAMLERIIENMGPAIEATVEAVAAAIKRIAEALSSVDVESLVENATCALGTSAKLPDGGGGNE